MRSKSPTGIRVRHSRSCPAATSPDARCKCPPSYEAFVFSVRDGKKLRKSFPSLAAAKAWRHDASTSVRKGTMRAPSQTTLREAAEVWLAGARDGSIRTRSGDPYKPSVLRSYEQVLRLLSAIPTAHRRLNGSVRVHPRADIEPGVVVREPHFDPIGRPRPLERLFLHEVGDRGCVLPHGFVKASIDVDPARRDTDGARFFPAVGLILRFCEDRTWHEQECHDDE